MAEKKAIKNRRKGEHHLALLALTSTEQTRGSKCPGVGDLAQLVDNRCGRQKRDELLTHIAHCDSCYQQWLVVSRAAREEGRQKNRRGRIISLLSKKPFLTAAGSVCAVVATITVFWATPFLNGDKQRHTVPQSVMKSKDVQRPGTSIIPEALKTETNDYSEETHERMRVKRISPVAKDFIPQQSPDKEQGKVDTIQVETIQQNRALSGDPLKRFKQQVVWFCQNDHTGLQEARKLRESAYDLNGSGAYSGSSQEPDMKKILDLLNGADITQSGKKELCDQLMNILFSDDN